MKTIQKKSIDELIRLSRKYWKTSDVDILPASFAVAKTVSVDVFGNEYHGTAFTGLINAIVSGFGLNKHATNKEIYAAFAAVGLPVSGAEEQPQDGD